MFIHLFIVSDCYKVSRGLCSRSLPAPLCRLLRIGLEGRQILSVVDFISFDVKWNFVSPQLVSYDSWKIMSKLWRINCNSLVTQISKLQICTLIEFSWKNQWNKELNHFTIFSEESKTFSKSIKNCCSLPKIS